MKESIPEQTPPPPIHFHPKIWLPILIAVVAAAGYLVWANNTQTWPFETNLAQTGKVFSTQQECESVTGKICVSQMCDLIPQGQTGEEYCGKGFKKGWVATEEALESNSSWKTYRNEEYGFEVKYPADFSLSSSQNYVAIVDGPKSCAGVDPYTEYLCFEDKVYIKASNNSKRQSIQDWFAGDSGTNESFTSRDTKLIAGVTAIVAAPKDTEGYGTNYIFTDPAKNHIYQLLFYAGIEESDEDQILSTFKFTK